MTLPLHPELGTRDQANLVRLDAYEEMVWVGTQRGRLLSYLANLETGGHASYSRFNIDVKEERVIEILTRQEGVMSLTRSSVLFHTRGGVGHPLASRKASGRMTQNGAGCLSALENFPSFNNAQLAVGGEKTLFVLDSMTGDLSTFFDVPHAISKIHSCKDSGLMAVGSSSGHLCFVEGRLPRLVHSSLSAHPCEVTSIASSGNYVFTCGKRSGGPQHVDVFVKMFDVRNMRQPIPPISVPSGASKVSVSQSGLVLILSSHGVWQQGDIIAPSWSLRNVEIFQTECFQPHSPDIDPTVVDWSAGDAVNALLDSAGVVHFWGNLMTAGDDEGLRINPSSIMQQISTPPSRQPVMPSYPMPVFSANREVVMESVGKTRVYSDTVRDGTWLSWFDSSSPDGVFFQRVIRHPPANILPDIKANEWVPNTYGLKYGTSLASVSAKDVRKTKNNDADNKDRRWNYTCVDYSVNHSLFPFASFNKTNRNCGLENGQGALDCLNPILQCLYSIIPLKTNLKAHVCELETCLSCELGFLFHMMDEARFSRTKVCQPVRVSRLVKTLLSPDVRSGVVGVLHVILETLRIEFSRRNQDTFLNMLFSPEGGAIRILNLHSSPGEQFIEGGKLELFAAVYNVKGTHCVAIVSVTDDLDTEIISASQRPSRSNSFATTSAIDVGSSPVLVEKEEAEWVLFNDFVVTESCLEEALLRPAVLAFYIDRRAYSSVVPPAPSLQWPVTRDMFEVDVNLSKMTNLENLRFEPLTPEEIDLVIRGDFTVALDTEFISIGLGAMEIREDGSREIGKPGDMTVGRVSVVRENGVPFIDHYVAVDESQVKDFVTRFSGIRPGDLDPATSSHWLVSSKALYNKLRFLVDCGCKFVGHGLHTDFRIINLWVPGSSLIDTVELFHLPSQRFLSLKFLASKLLNRSIQGDVHCSIEDAKTAYELYKVHQRLKDEGTLEQTIKGLYETGRASGWK